MKKLLLSVAGFFTIALMLAQPPAGEAQIGDVYGESFEMNAQEEIAEIANLKEGEVIKGFFTGRVEEVCSKKGCWIQLVLPNGENATIKMKDYGFFVPTALVGKEIIIQGKAELKITSIDELKHLAEDGGKSQEEIDAIDQPKQVISILADGIKVAG